MEAKIAAQHAKCVNSFMTVAAENKIKSTSQIEVAETLIKVSE
jgi:hypothetical protein